MCAWRRDTQSHRQRFSVAGATLVLLVAMTPVCAQAPTAAPRFELRDSTVRPSTEAPATSRFTLNARLQTLEPAPDPDARFSVKAGLKATTGACSADRIFANGFES